MVTTLSRFKGVHDLYFNDGFAEARPTLAKYVMQVIAAWSIADAYLLFMGRALLGGDSNALVATAAFQAVDNQTAQRSMVGAAAKAALPNDAWVLFEEAMNSTSHSRRVRHYFAHHIWITSDDLPDALLLQDPKDVNKEIAMRQTVERTEAIDRSTVFVWREHDFIKAVADAKRARTLVAQLESFVGSHLRGKPNEAIRQLLMNDHAIAQKIQGRNKQKAP